MSIDLNISTTFLGNTDTPNTYAGANSYKVKVNATATALEFVADSSGSDTNIMNANLTADANRTQDMNSFSMYFNNGKQFKWLNNVAPTIGEGSFDLQAYGSTNSDTLYRLKNGASDEIIIIKGDGNYTNKGERNFNSKPGANDAYTKFNAFGTFGINYFQFYRNNGGSYQGQMYASDDRINLSHTFGVDLNIFNGGVKVGAGSLNSSAVFHVSSTTKGFLLEPMTATQASAITPSEGLELNVSNTNGTFTSIGKWQYIGATWVKL